MTSIHEVSCMDPKDFDVLITDIGHHTLENEISEVIGVPYLTSATNFTANTKAKIGEAIIYGRNLPTIVPCVVNLFHG